MRTLPRRLFAALFVAAAAASAAPVGVTVNGTLLVSAGSTGAGWSYVSPVVTLSGAGPFTLSGTNTAHKVFVVVPEGVTDTVTLANLKIGAINTGRSAFALGTTARVSLLLAGTNTLASGGKACIEVAAGRTLSITNAPGDAAGALSVVRHSNGAGIGGGDGGRIERGEAAGRAPRAQNRQPDYRRGDPRRPVQGRRRPEHLQDRAGLTGGRAEPFRSLTRNVRPLVFRRPPKYRMMAQT